MSSSVCFKKDEVFLTELYGSDLRECVCNVVKDNEWISVTEKMFDTINYALQKLLTFFTNQLRVPERALNQCSITNEESLETFNVIVKECEDIEQSIKEISRSLIELDIFKEIAEFDKNGNSKLQIMYAC